jgi:hypothetical protein
MWTFGLFLSFCCYKVLVTSSLPMPTSHGCFLFLEVLVLMSPAANRLFQTAPYAFSGRRRISELKGTVLPGTPVLGGRQGEEDMFSSALA